MLKFTEYLIESAKEISQSDFREQIEKGQLDNRFVHFSDSEIFPPTQRSGNSAYLNPNGGGVGASVSLPRVGLFLWKLSDIKSKILKMLKGDLNAGISGLFTQRKYLYLAEINASASRVLRFSEYTQARLEKDVEKLKKAGLSFIFTDKDMRPNVLMNFEFGSQKSALKPAVLMTLPTLLSTLYQKVGKNYETDISEAYVPNDPRKIRFRVLPADIQGPIAILLAIRDGIIDQKDVVYQTTPIRPVLKGFIEKYGLTAPASEIDVRQTLDQLQKTAPGDIGPSAQMHTLTPDEYIDAFAKFIGEVPGLQVSKHPALRIWLTVLFFASANEMSWKQIWQSMDYDVLIDDDETLKVIPGIEKTVRPGSVHGVEETTFSRLDNEGSQIIVLDNSVLRDPIRVLLEGIYDETIAKAPVRPKQAYHDPFANKSKLGF